MVLRLDVDLYLDIHPVCALDCDHVGLAAVASIARTPSFVLSVPSYVSRIGLFVLIRVAEARYARRSSKLPSRGLIAGRSRGFCRQCG